MFGPPLWYLDQWLIFYWPKKKIFGPANGWTSFQALNSLCMLQYRIVIMLLLTSDISFMCHFFFWVIFANQGHISFRWIWNMFHFIIPENKIIICCFKKRYVSKLCFRKSFRILYNMSQNFIRFVKKTAICIFCFIRKCRDILHRQVELKNWVI